MPCHQHRFVVVIQLVCLFMSGAWPVVADEPAGTGESASPVDPYRLEPAVLPIVMANSDIGFGFGVLTFLSKMDPDIKPYRWQAQAQFLMSVKQGPDGAELPTHDHFLKLGVPGLAHGRLRLYAGLGFSKNIIAGYYGPGNASKAPKTDVARFYQYKLVTPNGYLMARIGITGPVSTFVGLRVQGALVDPYTGSLLEQQIGMSSDGTGPKLYGTHNHVDLGVVGGVLWDTRDDETNPQKGAYGELSVRGYPGGLVGAKYGYFGLHVQGRWYWALAGETAVLALRLIGDSMWGRVPFYDLTRVEGLERFYALGSERGVRGVPARRYMGKVKLLGNLELRSVFFRFNIGSQQFGLGASLFADGGRLFWELPVNQQLDADGLGLKFGVGGGPQILWGQEVVIRFDVAYSPDADPVGFYIEATRAF